MNGHTTCWMYFSPEVYIQIKLSVFKNKIVGYSALEINAIVATKKFDEVLVGLQTYISSLFIFVYVFMPILESLQSKHKYLKTYPD